MTPGRYVDRVRLEHARRLLEDTTDGVEEISRASGYGTPEAMRRAFVKTLGTAPAEYRRRFRPGLLQPTPAERDPMQIAIVLFDRFTALDAVGPYEILGRLPDAETVFVAERTGPVRNDTGSLALTADRTLAEVPAPTSSWCPAAPARPRRWRTRPCSTGCARPTPPAPGRPRCAPARCCSPRRDCSRAAAPPRTGWRWTTCRQFGAEPTGERVVTDGKYVTAAGVSSGIDMGLTLLGRIAGDEHAQAVQLLTEYDPQPPYDAGSPEKAPAAPRRGVPLEQPLHPALTSG